MYELRKRMGVFNLQNCLFSRYKLSFVFMKHVMKMYSGVAVDLHERSGK
jgi:hypothetical protein